jgi:hypothetical protein
MTHGDGDEAQKDATPEEALTDQTVTEQTGRTGEKPAQTRSTEEVGGPQGPEPTRFGDWERKGRCIDF